VNYFLDEKDDRLTTWKQKREGKGAEVFAAYLLINSRRQVE